MEFGSVMDSFEAHMASKDRSIKTIEGYRSDLKMIKSYFSEKFNGQVYVDDISTSDVEGYLLMLKNVKQYKAGSRNRHLNTMKSFYKFCCQEGWVQKNPVASIEKVKGQQKEKDILEIDEVELFVNTIDHPLIKVVTQFMYYTGLRISECLSLQIEDVDLEKRQVHVIAGKGNKNRIVPINQQLKVILTNYLSKLRPKTASAYFFASKRSGKFSTPYVNRVLDRTRVELGWTKKISSHSLRHSFASHLARKGVNIVDISKMMGHADLKTTSVYMHVNHKDLLDSVDQL
ncbi:hypothetical protein DH09_10120 [Bacillaceae bacterium JMAK1]|nr:hypothetical protein DH09_10120 [Bacillaceae bacterium JMAK1]